MNELQFSFDNIIRGNGIAISLTGMGIVFMGLVMISVYIAVLPKFLAKLDNLIDPEVKAQNKARKEAAKQKANEKTKAGSEEIDQTALMAAISCVIESEIEQEELMDKQRITMRRDEAQKVWSVAGKMRNISARR